MEEFEASLVDLIYGYHSIEVIVRNIVAGVLQQTLVHHLVPDRREVADKEHAEVAVGQGGQGLIARVPGGRAAEPLGAAVPRGALRTRAG